MASFVGFIAKRFARFLGTLFVVITLTFVMFRLAPGDPTAILVTGAFSEEARQQMLQQFGLHRPLHEQYLIFIKNMLTGNFGRSFIYRKPVWEVLVPPLLNTLILTVPAMTLILLTAYYFGTFLGWTRGTAVEKVGSFLIIGLRSIPHFVLGLILLIVFSYRLGWFPTGGMQAVADIEQRSVLQHLTDSSFYVYYALPFVTIFLHYLTNPTLLQRGNVISQRELSYVDLLRLKGLPERAVRGHAAKNSMLPLVTWASTLVSVTFGGVILIEVVFSWPGIGQELVQAVNEQDYPVAQGAFFLVAFSVLLANLVIDFLYAYLDPRITYGEAS